MDNTEKNRGRSIEGKAITVVYIVSQAHSGSTLLSQMIGSHSKAVTIGEVKDADELVTPCGCGAARVIDCAFWKNVDGKLEAHGDRRLTQLDLTASEPVRFAEDNFSFFRAVHEVTNSAVIVDSSKSLSRLKDLMRVSSLHVVPIFLRRDPPGVVNSNVRKGRPWFQMTLRHYAGMRRCIEYFRNVEHISLDYTLLASDPYNELQRVMMEIGLAIESEQMQWADRPNHAVNGNRMRFGRDSTIRPDIAWRTELSVFQQMVIRLLTNKVVLESDFFAAITRIARSVLRKDSQP